jgi:hypothetical protein
MITVRAGSIWEPERWKQQNISTPAHAGYVRPDISLWWLLRVLCVSFLHPPWYKIMGDDHKWLASLVMWIQRNRDGGR